MQILRKRISDVEKVCLQQREQFFEAVRELEFSCSTRINEIRRTLINSKIVIDDKTNFCLKKLLSISISTSSKVPFWASENALALIVSYLMF